MHFHTLFLSPPNATSGFLWQHRGASRRGRDARQTISLPCFLQPLFPFVLSGPRERRLREMEGWRGLCRRVDKKPAILSHSCLTSPRVPARFFSGWPGFELSRVGAYIRAARRGPEVTLANFALINIQSSGEEESEIQSRNIWYWFDLDVVEQHCGSRAAYGWIL